MQSISQDLHGWFDRISVSTTFFYHLIAAIPKTVVDSRFFLYTVGKSKRFWEVHFRKEYVRNQLLRRKGHCRQCGICCNLLFTCPMLAREGRCTVYGYCRPQVCKVFPISQRDIDEVSLLGGRCGYRFDREDLDSVNFMGQVKKFR
ncbi:MAG: hypothetical protein P8010_24960 [Desulfosarcinaceae bacterium]